MGRLLAIPPRRRRGAGFDAVRKGLRSARRAYDRHHRRRRDRARTDGFLHDRAGRSARDRQSQQSCLPAARRHPVSAGGEAMTLDPHSLFDINGKVAIVTGASGAFGALASEVLAWAGAKLVLTAGNAVELEHVAARCREIGAEVESVNKRPVSEDACQTIVEAAVARFGRVDILVVG